MSEPNDETEPLEPPDLPQWGVTLFMRFDADDPAEAVKLFLQDTLDVGLGNYVYTVRDERTGAVFNVENDVTYTEDGFLEKIAQEEADRIEREVDDGDDDD